MLRRNDENQQIAAQLREALNMIAAREEPCTACSASATAWAGEKV